MDYTQHISRELAMVLEDMGYLSEIHFFWDEVFVNEERPGSIPRGEFARLAQWSMLTTATIYLAKLCSDEPAFAVAGRPNLTLESVATPLLGNQRWGSWIKKGRITVSCGLLRPEDRDPSLRG